MKKSIGMAIIAGSVFAAPAAMAQQGMWEMSIAGNIEDSTSSTAGGTSTNTTNTFVNVDVGRYFTSRLVGRVDLTMFGNDTAGSKSVGLGVGAGVKYYFGDAAKATWVPFVNGGLNLIQFETTAVTYSGVGIVGGGGVSYFITEEVSGDISAQYFNNTLSGGGVDLDQDGIRVLFGLTARY